MRHKSFLVLLSVFIISCAGASHQTTSESYLSKIKEDPFFLTYPKYRIDHLIDKICIIGNGENKDYLSGRLTEQLMRQASIKVVAPGNIESILKGRIIEYETGLSAEESQALSQLLQVNHIVLFDENTTPHKYYEYGGMNYGQISFKIINTISGEIIFQTVKKWGIFYPDPRPNFSHVSPASSQYLSDNCLLMIFGELIFALGGIKTGMVPNVPSPTEPFVVGILWNNSPAQRAGIKEGDKVIGIEGVEINSWIDYANFMDNMQPKQGSTLKIRLKRAGKILDVELKYPLIPKAPVKNRHKQEDEIGTTADTSILLLYFWTRII